MGVTVINSARCTFYVYLYRIEGIPRYVGIGSGERYLSHLKRCRKKVKDLWLWHLRNALNEDSVVTIEFLLSSEDREKVSSKEKQTIRKFGRISEGGTLANYTEGGDGGITVVPGSRKITNGFQEKLLPPGKNLPKGWSYGTSSGTVAGYVTYHHPKTLHSVRLPSGKSPPEGYVKGVKPGLLTGPRSCTIWHNPKTGKMSWLKPGESTQGLVKGRSNKSSTSGKIISHDPKTGKMTFSEIVPKGNVQGYPKSHMIPGSIKCRVNKKVFSSVQEACKALGMTRYFLKKLPGFTMLD